MLRPVAARLRKPSKRYVLMLHAAGLRKQQIEERRWLWIAALPTRSRCGVPLSEHWGCRPANIERALLRQASKTRHFHSARNARLNNSELLDCRGSQAFRSLNPDFSRTSSKKPPTLA